MVYFYLFLIIFLLILFVPIKIRFTENICIRIFGFYIPLKKGIKKNGFKEFLNTQKKIFKLYPLLSELSKLTKISYLKIEETLPFKPIIYSVSWSTIFILKAYLDTHFKTIKNDYYNIKNGSKYNVDFCCIIDVKIADIIIVLIKNFRKLGGIYGPSHS